MGKYWYICLVAFVLCLSSGSLNAQNSIRFKNVTVREGLSMGTITAFAQDNKGFMWIATAEGLHRYDGVSFYIFKHENKKINSLTDSYITCLLLDGDLLYIGNHSGVVDVLNLKNYTFSCIKMGGPKKSFDLPINTLAKIDNTVVASTEGGGIWLLSKSSARPLALPNRSGHEKILLAHNNRLYISDRDTLFNYSNSKLAAIYSSNKIQITALAILENEFLIGSNKGLYRANNDFTILQEIVLPAKRRRINIITDIKVKNKVAWIGTMGGLLKLKGDEVSHYYTNEFRAYSLVNNQITQIFLDNTSTVLAGTIAGFSIYDATQQKFGLLEYFDYQGKTYNNNVYYTYEDRNQNIWLGTLTSGLIKLNADNKISEVYESVGDGQVETKAVRSMLHDSKNRFWVGTRDEGLFLLNQKTKQFKLVANVNNGKIGSNVIRSIFEDHEGNIWIGAQDGLYLYESKTSTFIHYSAEKTEINNSIYQITQHPKTHQLILASFRGGLQFFDIQTRTFQSLKYDEVNAKSLSNNNLMSLAWVNSDTLLIGTYGGGLNLYSFISKEFLRISEENGLQNNAVYGICYQGGGVCWLSTNDGIVRYNFRNKTFKNFKLEHYLQSTEFNEGAFLGASNGVMYFGGVNGLNYFNPRTMSFNFNAVPVYITDVRGVFKSKNNREYLLDYLNSRVEIDFVAPSFAHPDGVSYKYKLQGFDNNWIKAVSNTVVYPQISPGFYTFEVVAEDEFGNWQSRTSVSIRVHPPLWQKWWFIGLCLLIVASVIYIIFKFRTREISRAYKLQLVDSELSALRSQMNPHFIFNSLNSIQYYILKKEPKEAYSYLSKFASLMRKILHNSRLKQISLANEVEWLNLYLELEKLRMDNELDYSITTENIEDTASLFMPTMLIQPFVENSIVHGLLPKSGDRQLSINICRSEDLLVCTILDNGIGQEASAKVNEQRISKHKSAGLELTKKRLEILSQGKKNYNVQIVDLLEDGKSCGTKVILTVPLFIEKD